MLTSGEPYVGARPFTQTEEEFFFGRDEEANDLCALIAVNSIIVLHAQSGAGKSSLLAARVLPMLQKDGYVCLGTARVSISGDAESVRGGDTYTRSMLRSLGQSSDASISLREFISEKIAAVLKAGKSSEKRFVLVIDQFEELFTSKPARWQERGPFLAELAEAARENLRLSIVLSLREEFLASLDPLYRMCAGLATGRYQLKKLDIEAATKAITLPAQRMNVGYEPEALDLLLRRLFRLPWDAPDSDSLAEYAEPVQLQVVCQSIWASKNGAVIDVATVREFGQVERALGRYYERAVATVASLTGVSESEIRGWIERNLITPVRTRGLVRREKSQTKGLENEVLDKLVSEYLLQEEQRGKDTWCELAHDRLCVPILESNARWQQTQGLTETWKELSTQAQIWNEGRHDRRLLRGARLRAAREFLKRPEIIGFGIPDQISEYVNRSESAAFDRRARAIIASVLTAVAVGVGSVAWDRRVENERMLRNKDAELRAYEEIAADLGKYDDRRPLALTYALRAAFESRDAGQQQKNATAASLRAALRQYGHSVRLRPLRDEPADVRFDEQDGLAAVVLQNLAGMSVWDLRSGTKLLETDADVYKAQFSADSQKIAIATRVRDSSDKGSFSGENAGPFRLRVTVHDIYRRAPSRDLPQLSCSISKPEFEAHIACFAISRDFLWGAVRKGDAAVEVVNLSNSSESRKTYPPLGHRSERHVRGLNWARDAPVLLVTADLRTSGRHRADVTAFDILGKVPPRTLTRKASVPIGDNGFGYSDSGPRLWSGVSPNGRTFFIATSVASPGDRLLVECFSVANGARLANQQIEVGVGATPLFGWSRDSNTFVVVTGELKAWVWHPGENWREVATPPFGTLLWYAMNEMGEIGGLGCADSAANRITLPPQSCRHYFAMTWRYDAPTPATKSLAEFQYGPAVWASNSFGRYATGGGSVPEAYVKIYQADDSGVHSPEDDKQAGLSELIREGCIRLRNSPELVQMSELGGRCSGDSHAGSR